MSTEPVPTIRFRYLELEVLPQESIRHTGRYRWELIHVLNPSNFDYSHPVVNLRVDNNTTTRIELENVQDGHTYLIFRTPDGLYLIARAETLFANQLSPVDPLLSHTATPTTISTSVFARPSNIRPPQRRTRDTRPPRGSRSRSARRRWDPRAESEASS